LAYVFFILGQGLFQRGARVLYPEILVEGVNPMLVDLESLQDAAIIPENGDDGHSETHIRDTEKVITMDTEEFSHRKNNYSHINDEL
jgi:hypothetical protein